MVWLYIFSEDELFKVKSLCCESIIFLLFIPNRILPSMNYWQKVSFSIWVLSIMILFIQFFHPLQNLVTCDLHFHAHQWFLAKRHWWSALALSKWTQFFLYIPESHRTLKPNFQSPDCILSNFEICISLRTFDTNSLRDLGLSYHPKIPLMDAFEPLEFTHAQHSYFWTLYNY